MNDRILLYLATLSTRAGSGLTMLLLTTMSMPDLAHAKSIASNPAFPVQPLPSQMSCDAPVDASINPSNPSIETLEPASLTLLLHSTREHLIASSVEFRVDYPMLDFSIAESNAAIALFGCDCLSCINALRQLRTHALLNDNQPNLNQSNVSQSNLSQSNVSQGHCWSSIKQQPQQEIQEVLQILEAEEAQEAL